MRGLWNLIFSIVVFILLAIRFWGLDVSPPGFFADESAIAAQVLCVEQDGRDFEGRSWPLFSPVLGGGYITPVTLYFGAAWVMLFGPSIESFRSLAVGGYLMVLAGIMLVVYFASRDVLLVQWSCLATLISPWLFPLSRIFWDPILGCGLFALSLAALIVAFRRWQGFLVYSVLSALAAYAYPNIRIQMAMIDLYLVLYFWLRHGVFSVSLRGHLAGLAIKVVLFLPLLSYLADPNFLARGKMLAVWNAEHLINQSPLWVLWEVLMNLLRHLDPIYLLLVGDSNLRHSSGFLGLLGPLEMAGYLFVAADLGFRGYQFLSGSMKSAAVPRDQGLIRWHDPAITLSAVVFLSGLISSSLTWESIPHALRSLSSAPAALIFSVLVVGPHIKQGRAWVMLWLMIGFSAIYQVHYFSTYRQKAFPWFDTMIVQMAAQKMSLPTDYPELSRAYFSIRDGTRCEELRRLRE